jgi:hypothetical protein
MDWDPADEAGGEYWGKIPDIDPRFFWPDGTPKKHRPKEEGSGFEKDAPCPGTSDDPDHEAI